MARLASYIYHPSCHVRSQSRVRPCETGTARSVWSLPCDKPSWPHRSVASWPHHVAIRAYDVLAAWSCTCMSHITRISRVASGAQHPYCNSQAFEAVSFIGIEAVSFRVHVCRLPEVRDRPDSACLQARVFASSAANLLQYVCQYVCAYPYTGVPQNR